jgi:hypothetical protein
MSAEEQVTKESSGWKERYGSAYVTFIRNVDRPTELTYFDPQKGDSEPVKEETLHFLFTKDEMREIYRRTVIARFQYRPDISNPLFYEKDCLHFNTYTPPSWMRDLFYNATPLPTDPTQIPAVIDTYLTHLTNNHQESKEYVLDWMANAVKGRNLTILVTIGQPGIGKGTLGEVLRHLVGPKNFYKGRDSIFKKDFNAPLRNRKLVYINEVSIKSKEEANRIKDVVDSTIEIERKGYDASEETNYASFYLSSNFEDAIRIEANDRRFSIIELTKDSLLKSQYFDKTQIKDLTAEPVIAEFARYLLSREIKNDMGTPFRNSSRYDKIYLEGQTEWEKALYEHLIGKAQGSEFDMAGIHNILESVGARKPLPGRTAIKKFVEKFPTYLSFKKSGAARRLTILETLPDLDDNE